MRLRKASIILVRSNGVTKPTNPWDRVITDAQEMIEDARTSIRQLRRSIELSKKLRDRGAVFPGLTERTESDNASPT